MKTPEKEMLQKWVNGELSNDSQLAEVEKWADANPDEASRLLGELEQGIDLSIVDAELEPPYPDFFNAKLEQEIAKLEKPVPSTATNSSLRESFNWLLAPVAALAMVGCFFLGFQFKRETIKPVRAVVENLPVEAYVYVPHESVTVDVYDSDTASMVVLDGLEPIADDDIAMLNVSEPEKSVRLISAEERDIMY